MLPVPLLGLGVGEAGGLLRWLCGSYCLLAFGVWCGGLGALLVCGGLPFCAVSCWRLFFPDYRGATRRGRVRRLVSFPPVSLYFVVWHLVVAVGVRLAGFWLG